MATTAARKYRGKYPTRINGVWGTYNKGVYGCSTNAGATYFFAARSARAAGYATSTSQVLGLCAAGLPWLHTSIADACKAQG